MILITGGSGQLATLVAQKARERGLSAITGSRMASRQDDMRPLDFDDPTSLDFHGIETLFLVSAGYAEDDVVCKRHDNAITAAERDGVKHVVYTSLTGTGDHLGFALAHRWTEGRLKESRLSWTILRNGLYAELLGALLKPADGTIRAPFGSGRISVVAREDLADAAIAVLADPHPHIGMTYELTGPDAISASVIAEALKIDYAPATFADWRAHLDTLRLLPFQPPMLMSIHSSAAAGFLESPQSDLTKLLPTPPRDPLPAVSAAARG